METGGLCGGFCVCLGEKCLEPDTQMVLDRGLILRENSGPWRGLRKQDAAQLSVPSELQCTYIAQIPQPRAKLTLF